MKLKYSIELLTIEERLEAFSNRYIDVKDYARKGCDLQGDVAVLLARYRNLEDEYE